MAQRRLHGLQRVLGTNALVATAYGNVGSSIYYVLGLVAGLALGLTPVVFILAGIFFYMTAASYAEATAMYPEAGGSSSFARHAFNEFWSFFAGWGQMLNYIITVAISAFFLPHYLGSVLGIEALEHAPGDIFFGIGVIALLSLINVRGVKESAGVNILLSALDFATQLLLVLLGFALVLSPDILIDNVDFGVAPTWKDFLIAIPIGMIAYTGIETISNMAEEAKDETRSIPQAISRVRLAVFAIYFTLPAVALSALPVTRQEDGSYQTLLGLEAEEGGFAGNPVLGIVKSMDLGALQTPVEIYLGTLAATILFVATNAGIIGVSRLVYSMGVHRQLPDRLRQLHPRYGTPWIGILIFGGVSCLTLIPGQATFLANMYAFGAMLSFTIAHVAVITLRRTQPDRERPYRGPGTILGMPAFALVGGVATSLAFVVVTVLNLDVAVAGTLWLAIGITIYVVFRRRQGLDLTTTAKVAIPSPVTEAEAEYDSVLIAFDSARYHPQAVATAARLAARRRRGIHVLVTLTVPASAPIDADLPELQSAAESVIEQARIQGGRRVTGHVERVRAGQAGRMIIDEAVEMRATAIVMPLFRRGTSSVFGKTVETVLADRPCRVIIESEPGNGTTVNAT